MHANSHITYAPSPSSPSSPLNQTGSDGELQTDGAIRGKDISHLEGRELQAASSWLDESTAAGLEGSGERGVGAWNQFEANAKLKDYKRNAFDENLYTKRLDMGSMSHAQIQRAEKMARDIESTTSTNIHVQQERGHELEFDVDEEALFSGVMGTGGYADRPAGFGGRGGGSAPAEEPWRRGQIQGGRGSPSPRGAPNDGGGNGRGGRSPTVQQSSPKNGQPRPDRPESAQQQQAQEAPKSKPATKAWDKGAGGPGGALAPAPAQARLDAHPPGLATPSSESGLPSPAPAQASVAPSAQTPALQKDKKAADGAGGDESTLGGTKVLSAAAKEWKPNFKAAAFTPKSMSPMVQGVPMVQVVPPVVQGMVMVQGPNGTPIPAIPMPMQGRPAGPYPPMGPPGGPGMSYNAGPPAFMLPPPMQQGPGFVPGYEGQEIPMGAMPFPYQGGESRFCPVLSLLFFFFFPCCYTSNAL